MSGAGEVEARAAGSSGPRRPRWQGPLAPLELALVAFLALRLLLAPLTSLDVTMDEGRYLGLARHFPWHTLYGGGQLYLFHPPLYPWCLGLLQRLTGLPDHVAGLVVSLGAVGGSFLATARLGRHLGLGRLARALALLALAWSAVALSCASAVMKEGLYLLLITAWAAAAAGTLRRGGGLLLPGLLGLCLVLETDLSLLGFGVLGVLTLALARDRSDLRLALRLGLLLLLPLLLWWGIKAQLYTAAPHRPASVDGMIVDTTSFGLAQVYSPFEFPEHEDVISLGQRSLLRRLRAFAPLLEPDLGAASWPGGWWLPLLLLAPALARGAARRRLRANPELAAALLAAGLSLPALLHYMFLPRLGAAAAPPLALLQGQGLATLLLALRAGWRRHDASAARSRWRRLATGLAVVPLALTVAWLLGRAPRPKLVLGLPKRVESSQAAAWLATQPGGAIMAQLGYGQELAYQLDRPVIGLPYWPDRLEEFIAWYGVDTIVCGDHYWVPLDTGRPEEVLCNPTIAWLFRHPERFELVRVIEDRSLPHWPDRVRIFRVRQP